MTKPVEEIENILYDLNIEDKDGDVWIDNRKEIAEAILSWHHQAMKQEIRKVGEKAREDERRKWKSKGYVDATPDGNYALRLLQQARADCDVQWSDNTAGLSIKNPLLKELNRLQKQRAKELDDVILALEGDVK